jgi:methyltransferase-like protein 23
MAEVLRTTAGDLPLQEYALELDGRRFGVLHTGTVLSLADEDRFLRPHREGDGKVPYGVVLWPAAIALAHEIATRTWAGLRVLELGGGTGLPGIVAASLGGRVVQTDNQEVALHLASLNAERNGVGPEALEPREADWTEWTDDTKYDCIVGADVLYADALHPHLRRIFENNLAPRGTLLLSDPFRADSIRLLEAMESDGWRVSMNKWTVGVTPPERAVGVFELTRS